jgi:hypothetical protein
MKFVRRRIFLLFYAIVRITLICFFRLFFLGGGVFKNEFAHWPNPKKIDTHVQQYPELEQSR